jgi:hypothetical protein
MLTPDMSIKISLHEFHRIHDEAWKAKDLIKTGIKELSVDQLRDAWNKLHAGQSLFNAETGPDFMYAASYHDTIALAEAELATRPSQT